MFNEIRTLFKILMQLTHCQIVATIYWWFTKDLASRMQMTDVKTLTRELLYQSIVYNNGNYTIDLRQLKLSMIIHSEMLM